MELLGNSKEHFNNRITDADVEALVDALVSTGTQIEGLYLFYNLITDVGAAALARLFHVGASSTTYITYRGRLYVFLQDSGAYTCNLQRLDLRGNGLSSVGCKALTEALISTRNSTLILLNLNGNPIGDAGGIAVAEWLQVALYISQRSLGGEFQTLNCVQNGTPIEILDLGNTELETDAIVALSAVLHSNTTLQHLSLENSRLFSRMVRGSGTVVSWFTFASRVLCCLFGGCRRTPRTIWPECCGPTPVYCPST